MNNKYRIGVKDLFTRIKISKLFLLFIVTIINSFISISFVAITTFASNLTNDSTLQDIFVFAIKGIGMYILVFLAMYFTEVLINDILKDLSISFINDLSKNYYKNYGGNNDEATSIINQDVSMIIDEFYVPLLSIPTYIFRSVIPIIYLVSQNFVVGSLFTIGALLMLIPQYLGKKKIADLGKVYSDNREKSLATLIDVFKGKNMIKNNQADEYFLHKLISNFRDTEISHNKLKNFRTLIFCLSGPLKGVADVLPFAIGIYLMRYNPAISLVLLMAMLATASNLKQQFQQVIYLYGDIMGTPEVRKKVSSLIDKSNELDIKNNMNNINKFDYLSINNLSKSYGEKVIFENISLKIKKGSKILIIGESGIGKSTLFKILMGQEKFDSGDIYLDNNGKKESLAGNISLVEQNPYLINSTIRENLCLGNKYSDTELIKVLDRVKLLNHFKNNPLEFIIEKNGENISVGQKMRLELARALLRNTEIILVDEASSNLDKENAKIVKDILLDSNKTIIEIAHHYSETNRYDYVLEIVDKKIMMKSDK